MISPDADRICKVGQIKNRNNVSIKDHNEKPYYNKEYLIKTKKWFNKLKDIKIPCVYIIIRNSEIEIQNFINIIKKTDWDRRSVKCLNFKKK